MIIRRRQTTGLPMDRRMLVLVGLLTTLGPMCVDLYVTAMPAITRSLNTGASTVQLSLTTCLLGLAAGQVFIGPLSDRFGRKSPLLVGMVAFVVVSALCAAAPNIGMLILLRFLQGFTGSAGAVTARAIVRDLYTGIAAARFFSFLVTVTGVSPLVAPQLGAFVLRLGSWRYEFVAVALLGSLVAAVVAALLPETLPPNRRSRDGFVAMVATARVIAVDRVFALNGLALALGFGSLWGYVAGSPYVLQNTYGLSPAVYGLVFAANGIGMVLAAQINARLLPRYGPTRLLSVGLVMLAASGLGVLGAVLASGLPVGVILAAFFVACSANGFIGANAMTLAMSDFPHAAGTAAALLGVCQYALGALTAPLAGVGGPHDSLPTGVLMCGFGLAAIAVRFGFRPVGPARSPAAPATALDMT